MHRISIVVLMLLLVTTPAWAQVGGVNPNLPVTITVPPPAGSPPGTPPTTRPSIPFTSDPNQQNNPFPMLLNAGVSGTGGYGVPIRYIYMPPQPVQIVVYVREQEVTGDQWVTQYTELPGYYFTETTLGYLYPDRWALYTPARGIYQWQRVPAVFQPK
ncbi:MAG TPA: hypothetical protein VE932_15800 [Patescibacteria group bacterium]|nr:hypothetical protein [Patescibacteria group bacterium]